MKAQSLAARAYIWSILAIGGVVFVTSLLWLPVDGGQWVAFGILATLAAVAQLFPVVNPNHQAYYVSLVFLFAGVLLLPAGAISLMVVLCFIPEWIKIKYPWYIQLFNIANFLIDALLARGVFIWAGENLHGALGYTAGVVAALVAATLFTALNHLLLAVVLRLARGHSWRETHLFEVENLLTDGTLAALGIIAALLWEVDPWLTFLCTAPLFLIYRALNTPNLEEQARTDAKTGLYNARHFYRVLHEELRRAARFDRPVAVIMADLDLLRNINNSYGHLAGDVVLKGVAHIIKNGLREYDMAARFGGEEFVMLLPESDADQAYATAERLRKQVEETRFQVSTTDKPIQATLSLGVSAFPAHGREPEEIIHHADLAVYYAKLQGRNRSWVCSEESMALAASLTTLPHQERLFGADIPPSGDDPDAVLAAGRPGEVCSPPASAPEPDKTRADEWADDECPPDSPGPESAGPGDVASDKRGVRPWSRRSSRAGDMSWQVAAYVGVLAAGALALYLFYHPWDSRLDWTGLSGLAILTILAQKQAINIYGSNKISTSAIMVLAGGVLFGIDGAILLATLTGLSQWAVSRGSLQGAVFDVSDLTLSAAASAATYQSLVSLLPNREPLLLLGPALLAALVFYVVNVGLLALAMGLRESRSPLRVWSERFQWLFVYYVAYGVLSLAIALAYLSIGLYGTFAFFVPLVLMRYVMKQYVDRTEGNVAQLEKVNRDLLNANAEVTVMLQQLRATYDATILALSAALDSRDSETEGHSRRVVRYVELIAKQLGLTERDVPGLVNGALLHDVGKIGVPDAILKKPGPLTRDEWALMKAHPEQGYRMLMHIDFLVDALPIVRHHHEQFDGSGYPDGLKGDEIPMGARIFALADTFDAMTSHRPYRRAMLPELAREEIARCSGTQFDPGVVEAFLLIDVADLAGATVESAGENGWAPDPSSSASPSAVRLLQAI